MHAINFFRVFLGSLFGLLLGLLTVQLICYVQYGTMMNMLERLRFSALEAQDLLILLYAELIGITVGVLFVCADSLKTQRLHIFSLQEETEKKDKLLGFAAHALRTPATSFKWALYNFLEGEYGAFTRKQKRILKDLSYNAEALISLIEDYLDISKFRLRKLEVSLKRVTVDALESEVKKGMEAQLSLAEKKKVTLKYVCSLSSAQKSEFVLADTQRLMRVIENLVENAIDYTLPGGKVLAQTSIGDDAFRFQISDTGIGIRGQDKPRIFSEFFRSSNARELKSTGSGIGLFLASMIIKAHRGKIWFVSEENKGTTFCFQIPFHHQTSQESLEEFLRKV